MKIFFYFILTFLKSCPYKIIKKNEGTTNIDYEISTSAEGIEWFDKKPRLMERLLISSGVAVHSNKMSIIVFLCCMVIFGDIFIAILYIS